MACVTVTPGTIVPGGIVTYPEGWVAPSWNAPPPLPQAIANVLKSAYRTPRFYIPPSEEDTMNCDSIQYDEGACCAPTPEPASVTLKYLRRSAKRLRKQIAATEKRAAAEKVDKKVARAAAEQQQADRETALATLREVAARGHGPQARIDAATALINYSYGDI